MHLKLPLLYKLCYLFFNGVSYITNKSYHYLRCTYIPFIPSLNVHMQYNSHNLLGESEESCDTEIMKRSESFNTGPKTLSYKEPGPQTAELDWEQGDTDVEFELKAGSVYMLYTCFNG